MPEAGRRLFENLKKRARAHVESFSKRVERAARPDIEARIGDGRSAEADVIQIVDRQCVPLAARLQDGELAGLAQHVHFPIAGHRRRPVMIERALQPRLFDHFSSLRIQGGGDAAILHQVQHIFVQQRRRHVRDGFSEAPQHPRIGDVAAAAAASTARMLFCAVFMAR